MKTNETIMTDARTQLRGNWGIPVMFAFLYVVFQAILVSLTSLLQIADDYFFEDDYSSFLAHYVQIQVLAVVLLPVFLVGWFWILLTFIRTGIMHISHILHGFRTLFVKSIKLNLLMLLYMVLWGLLLIVPGIIKGFAYALSYFVLVDNPHMTATEAITQSRVLMDGHKGKLFFLCLRFVGWGILTLLSLGVGFVWLIPYVHLSVANFYEEVQKAHSSEGEAAAT